MTRLEMMLAIADKMDGHPLEDEINFYAHTDNEDQHWVYFTVKNMRSCRVRCNGYWEMVGGGAFGIASFPDAVDCVLDRYVEAFARRNNKNC